jgi:hypothetical protein
VNDRELAERLERDFGTASADGAGTEAPSGGAGTAGENGAGPGHASEDARVSAAREIVLGGEPREMVAECLAAIVAANDPPSVFVRGGHLCRFLRDERGHGALVPMGDAAVRVVLERSARFLRGDKSLPAPRHLIESVRALGDWPDVVPVEAIVETPVLRPDGTVLDQAGYDAQTRLLYDPHPDLHVEGIPEIPTDGQASHALGLLREDLLGDFPFAATADEANALGLLLTPIVRHLLALAPLAVIDAPRAGSGKGLLASVVAIIATGRPAPVMAAPTDEAEWGKVITSMLENGSTFVFIDEAATLRSRKLGAALTASEHRDRRLGKTQMIGVAQRATWIAAGNNVQLGGDIPRRSFRIRLDPKMARPWTRQGFRHAALEEWTLEHRGDLLAALLTLARAWHAAGSPPADTPALGSFEPWAKTVGGILQHAGVTGFLGNLSELYDENDEEASAWETLLRTIAAIFDAHEFSTGELAAAIDQQHTLADALPSDLAEKRRAGNFTQLLGKALRRHVETRHGDDGIRITQAGEDPRNRTPRWQIAADLTLRECGSAGSKSPDLIHDAHPHAQRPKHSRNSRTPATTQGTNR